MQINHADEFIKNARRYERYPKQRYFADESDYTEVWYETIHRHLEENILPKIKKGGELFIDYWPAWFVVDRQHTLRQGTATGALYNYEYGSHGTGYICITSQHLYIIFMRLLTEQFPLTKPSMRRFILGALSRRVNRLRPFQSDYTWMLSPADIRTISMSSTHEAERIKMVTSLGTWEVYEHFIDQRKDVFGAIESLRRGEFSKLIGLTRWGDSTVP
jgi:hypothetical protein